MSEILSVSLDRSKMSRMRDLRFQLDEGAGRVLVRLLLSERDRKERMASNEHS